MNTTGTEDLLDALDEYPPMSDEELQLALAAIEKPTAVTQSGLREQWLRLQREIPAIEK